MQILEASESEETSWVGRVQAHTPVRITSIGRRPNASLIGLQRRGPCGRGTGVSACPIILRTQRPTAPSMNRYYEMSRQFNSPRVFARLGSACSL